jgi:hypothetical protein
MLQPSFQLHIPSLQIGTGSGGHGNDGQPSPGGQELALNLANSVRASSSYSLFTPNGEQPQHEFCGTVTQSSSTTHAFHWSYGIGMVPPEPLLEPPLLAPPLLAPPVAGVPPVAPPAPESPATDDEPQATKLTRLKQATQMKTGLMRSPVI